MKSETSTTIVLKVMNVLFWIVFIGLCIKTGALLTSLIVSLINPAASKNLYMDLNLTQLLNYDKVHYINVASLLICVTGMQAIIAYLVVKISMSFNIAKPFSMEVHKLIEKISYWALFTGILALLSANYCKPMLNKGTEVPINWGAGEILFFAGIIFIIAQVFKKGIELQTENELTV